MCCLVFHHKQDGELDGYQLFDMIVAKWGVPYG